jgi:hypothetical protein
MGRSTDLMFVALHFGFTPWVAGRTLTARFMQGLATVLLITYRQQMRF